MATSTSLIGLPAISLTSETAAPRKSSSLLNIFASRIEEFNLLCESCIFKNLDTKNTKKIARHCEFVTLEESKPQLFNAGDKADSAYIVDKGAVVAYNDKLQILFKENSLFGELAFFTEGIRTLSVKAFGKGKTVLLKIPGSTFRKVIYKHFNVLKDFFIRISDAVRLCNEMNVEAKAVSPLERKTSLQFSVLKEQELYDDIIDQVKKYQPKDILSVEPKDYIYEVFPKLLNPSIHAKCESLLELVIYLRTLQEVHPEQKQEISVFEIILLQQFHKILSHPHHLDGTIAAKLLFICVQHPSLHPYFDIVKVVCKHFYQPNLKDTAQKETYFHFQLSLFLYQLRNRTDIPDWTSQLKEVLLMLKQMEIFNFIKLFEKISFMGKVDLFFAAEKHIRHAKEILFKQGDPGDAMYIITKGLAAVIVEIKEKSRSANGKEEIKVQKVIKAFKSAGDFFGDIALIDGQTRSATIEILENGTELLKIGKEAFETSLRDNKQILIELIQTYCLSLLEHNRNVGQNASFTLAKGTVESSSQQVSEPISGVHSPRRKKTDQNLSESDQIAQFLKQTALADKLADIQKKHPILSLHKQLEKIYKFKRDWKQIPEDMNNLYGIDVPVDANASPRIISTIPLIEIIRSLFPDNKLIPVYIKINQTQYHSHANPREHTSIEETLSQFLLEISKHTSSPVSHEHILKEIQPLLEDWKKWKSSPERDQYNSNLHLPCEEIARGCTNNAWMPADQLIRTSLDTINIYEGTSKEHYHGQLKGISLEIHIVGDTSSVTQTKYAILMDPKTRGFNRFAIHAIIPFKWQLFPNNNPPTGILTIEQDTTGIMFGPDVEINKQVLAKLLQLFKRYI
ncbi:MAG: cyclic nucleotide-binding domain-containing protein [Parachlamydiales bacterium]|jgi:CRP-like cAMP-binding protein